MKLDAFQDLVADKFNRYRNKNSKYRLGDLHKDKDWCISNVSQSGGMIVFPES
jgi:hypothetical protein